MAAMVIEILLPKWLIPSEKPPMVTSATPRLAPLLTPNIYGPAKGLRNSVCIISPLTDNAIPANMAVSILGKRKELIICDSTGDNDAKGNSQRLPTHISNPAKKRRRTDRQTKTMVVLFIAAQK